MTSDSVVAADSGTTSDSTVGIDAFDAAPDAALDTSFAEDTPPPIGSTCDAPILIAPGPPPTGVFNTGDSSSFPSHPRTFACGSGSGPEVVYEVTHAGGDLWLETLGTSYGTLIELRTACNDAASEIACSDKTSNRQDSSRILYRQLLAGIYYLIVQRGDDSWCEQTDIWIGFRGVALRAVLPGRRLELLPPVDRHVIAGAAAGGGVRQPIRVARPLLWPGHRLGGDGASDCTRRLGTRRLDGVDVHTAPRFAMTSGCARGDRNCRRNGCQGARKGIRPAEDRR